MIARLLARLAELEAFVYEPQQPVVQRPPDTPNPFAALGDADLMLIVNVIDGEAELAAIWEQLSPEAQELVGSPEADWKADDDEDA